MMWMNAYMVSGTTAFKPLIVAEDCRHIQMETGAELSGFAKEVLHGADQGFTVAFFQVAA